MECVCEEVLLELG